MIDHKRVIVHKNGDAIDYVYNKKKFYQYYMVGCLVKETKRTVTLRVRGIVPDLKHVVIKKR